MSIRRNITITLQEEDYEEDNYEIIKQWLEGE